MGSELLQDGLDMWPIFGRADLATRDAPDEYFAWWRDGGKSVIAVVDTGTFSFHVPPISIEVRDVRGQIVPPTPVTPQHHLAFRFYRLSQVSDDLFDAFRNMYLAVELLLSAKYPKGVEHEIDWLRASLVYLNARLPLFHAKDGRIIFERSSRPRSNARLANQTRCGSVTSMSRTFNVSAPACPITVATLAPPAAQYSRAAPRRRGGVSADERWSCRASGAAFIVTRPPVPIHARQLAWPNGARASSRSGPPQRVKVLKHDAKGRWRRRRHDQRRNLLLFSRLF